jgi:DNA-binding CsgD family transcriptional regulator
MTPLTPAEIEILRGLAEGKRQKQVCKHRQYLRVIRQKLGAKTTIQAIIMLVRQGII